MVKSGYFFGFSTWKHPFMSPFFSEEIEVHFINPFFKRGYLKKALAKGLNSESTIYIWGKKPFFEVEVFAKNKGIEICRIEDGFVRSVGLGSDLTQPYSLVVDTTGIYFDPTQESDLEHLLNSYNFSNDELRRAKNLRQYLLKKKLSKYNNYENQLLSFPKDKKIVLVPGQVEDDASIKFGAPGMSNLKLLEEARKNAPGAYLVFKPHPDVLVGNRVGQVSEVDALQYADEVVTEVSLDSVLSHCDEVHTMTSLVGFEALIRGLKVYTYGLPFYAGWGLSVDKEFCERRQRVLSIDALTAGTLLLYPRYINPETLKICEVEVTLEGLQKEKEKLAASFVYRVTLKVRNYISRKLQQIVRLFG